MDAFNRVLGFLVLGIGTSLVVSGIRDLIASKGFEFISCIPEDQDSTV